MRNWFNKIMAGGVLSATTWIVAQAEESTSVVPEGLLNEASDQPAYVSVLPHEEFFTSILPAIIADLLILAGVIAFISFLYSGVLMIISADKEEKLEEAKKNMLYSLIGLAIAGFAYSAVAGILRLPF